MGDANSPPAASSPTPSEEDYGSWTWKQKFEDLIACDPSRNIMPKHPYYANYFKEKLQDSVKQFYQVCNHWSCFMGLREFLYPEILSKMASYNALRCARVALQGGAPLRGLRADPNGRHRYGFTPLDMAAENFSVDMVKLLFRHGASANIRTKGEDVVEGLLPLHVAVENTSMHKYLEDNWADGDHIVSLIFLLCLPEMKMFLDTTRLIAKQTDSIVDEVWNYIRMEKLVEAAILLLAAQKQLRGCLNKSSSQVSLNGFDIVKSNIDEALDTLHLEVLAMVQEGKNGKVLKKLKDRKEALLTARALVGTVHKTREAAALLTEHEVSLNGFDIVKSRIDEALDSLHRKGLAMVNEGKNGKALQMLRNKKEALLTAHALVGIIQKAGEALEGYIQTYPEVSHEEIVEHVSSILTSSGVVYSGKGIDTGNLECYQYGEMPIGTSRSESGDCEKTNEADKSSSLEDKVITRILMKHPPKGLAIKEVRNMFFPYWKSVLSCRFMVKIVPGCQPSRKDLRSAEASKKGTKKSMGNLGSMVWPQLASNYESRRMLCAVASMSRKVLFKRT
ncbi:hypothetical protein C2845_PM07G36770 [Panicum miliaceum]|uniref:Uncharacterized protein n=1 Tax=Panicum miliaceum TaxID=4540 RepID=A0A3L6SNF8_PANMI|nr:hypothetical protein C2845_PM07G36770 [Panicum miliaceum]